MKAGRRKKGGELQSPGTARVGRSRKGGVRGAVGVVWELREEKGGLSAFCAEATHAPGGGKGGSGMGSPHRGERGGVRHGCDAQRGRGPVEQKLRRGSAGDAGTEEGREAPTGGPARRVGPRRRDREEGREGDRWARFFKFNPNLMIQTV
jgi:hypothetical protein